MKRHACTSYDVRCTFYYVALLAGRLTVVSAMLYYVQVYLVYDVQVYLVYDVPCTRTLYYVAAIELDSS